MGWRRITQKLLPFVSHSIVSLVSNVASLATLTLIVQSRWGLAGLYCKGTFPPYFHPLLISGKSLNPTHTQWEVGRGVRDWEAYLLEWVIYIN